MKNWFAKHGINIGISIFVSLLCLAGVEIFIRFYYSSLTDAAQLLPQGLTQAIDQAISREGKCVWRDTIYPHPYLNFVHVKPKDCEFFEVNSYGFQGPEFPKENSKEYFEVLVLGGSVANHLAFTLHGNGLLRKLESYTSTDGRPIKAYTMATASWKQPQHLFAYLMYQDLFDGVITIEGFNEGVTINNPKWRVFSTGYFSLPRRGYPDFESEHLVAFGSWLKSTWMKYSWLNSSYAYSLFVGTTLAKLNTKIEKELYGVKINSMLSNRGTKVDTKTYVNFLKVLDTTTQANGQKFAYFLQPVALLYKPLPPEEKPYFITGQFYRTYMEIEREVMKISKRFNSLIRLFVNTKEKIYIDPCHMQHDPIKGKSLGYEMMVTAITNTLESQWKLKKLKK